MQLVHNKFKVHKSDPFHLCMTDILVYAKNVVIQMHGDFPSNLNIKIINSGLYIKCLLKHQRKSLDDVRDERL